MERSCGIRDGVEVVKESVESAALAYNTYSALQVSLLSVCVVIHEHVSGFGTTGQQQRGLGPGHAGYGVGEGRYYLLLLTLKRGEESKNAFRILCGAKNEAVSLKQRQESEVIHN